MGKQTSIKAKHFKSQMGDDDKEREKSQLVHLYPSFWTVTQTQTLCNKIGLRYFAKRNEMVLCETALCEMVLCETVLCEMVLSK